MKNQKQKTSDNAIAIQSAHDTNLHLGYNAVEVGKVVREVLQSQVSIFKEIAAQEVDKRTTDLGNQIVRKLLSEGEPSLQALKDPDFQYLLGRAQQAYARSGEPVVAETLVDLIGLRSKQKQRDRLSLTLNEAVEKTALLTKNEFAELSLLYFFRYSRNDSFVSLKLFAHGLKENIIPLLPDISPYDTSYSYLVSQNCATIESFALDFYSALKNSYAGLFSKGFTMEEFNAKVPEDFKLKIHAALVVQCTNNESKFQFSTLASDAFEEEIKALGGDEDLARSLWKWFGKTFWNEEEFLEIMSGYFPEIRNLNSVWNRGELKHMTLTPLGMAIGYANLNHIGHFKADLSDWIK